MRLVVQRVNKAKVSVKGRTIGNISKGLFVLLGISAGDKKDDAKLLAQKLAKLRIMADKNGKMNLSVSETKSEIMVVSQFTLYADTSAGNRPSFIKAGNPKLAEESYKLFIDGLITCGVKVKTGRFGAYMKINAELDGPVTIIIDSHK